MKKGQIQIQETIFVLFSVLILLVIAMIFFFSFQKGNVEEIYQDYQESKFQEMLLTVPNLPEIKCSELTKEEECIDLYKARAFSEISSQGVLYRGEFGYKEINLEVGSEKIIIYQQQKVNYENLRVINSPVSVYDPKTEKYKIGVLEIKWYQ